MNNVDLGQIFTRRILADYMVSLFTLGPKSVVLDPCFGEGVFIDSILSNTDYVVQGYEIDEKLYETYKKMGQSGTLLHKDEFLLSDTHVNYDGIIMNPPYIRHEKINDMSHYGVTKSRLRMETIFSKLPRTANLYMYFVVKAIDLVRPHGELIVIFPESWLTSKGGKTFRDYISAHCSVEKRIHVSGQAFEKDALVDVIILKLKKNKLMADCEPLYINIEGNVITNKEIKYFHQTSTNRIHFSNYASIRRGLSTGSNEIFVNPPLFNETKHIRKIISSPKSVFGFSTINAMTDKLLVVDSNVKIDDRLKQYLNSCENTIQKLGKPKTLATKIKNGERWFSVGNINSKGIIFGYMVRSNMRFILNDSDVTVRDNFYIISPNIDRHIMLALLNNYYVYAQLENKGRHYGGGMLKLQKYDIESLMLTNLSIISANDRKKLHECGHRLAETGDKTIVAEITALLEKYEPINTETIKSQYEYMTRKRLENGK